MTPRVSVCIPIYNGAAYLAECIDSVLRQTYSDYEIILGDNNSRDNSFEIISRYVADNPDRRLVALKHDQTYPMAESWNRCVAAASGEYVKVLPCDDILADSCLARQAAILDQFKPVDLSCCGKFVMDSNGKPRFRVRSLSNGIHGGTTFVAQCLKAGRNQIGEPGSMLFRRAAFLELGGFDSELNYHLDFDLWLRMAERANLHYDRDCLCYYRLHQNSGTISLFAGIEEDFSKLLQKHETALGKLIGDRDRAWLPKKVWLITRARALFTKLTLAFE